MALVLSRKCGESVLVGETVITVSRVGLGNVRLAFEGPAATKIIRTELIGAQDGEITETEQVDGAGNVQALPVNRDHDGGTGSVTV